MAGPSQSLSMYDTGDANRLLSAASNNPQQANAWLQNAQSRVQLSQEQFKLGSAKLSALNDVASAIMADPTPQNLNARLSDAVQQGVIAPDMATKAISEVSTFGGDPNKIRQWAFQHAQGISSVQQRMSAAFGDPSQVDTGNALAPVLTKTGPQAGVYAGGGAPMEKSMAPGTIEGPSVMTPAGPQATRITTGQFADISSGKARVDANGRIVYGAATAAGKPQATDSQGRAIGPDGKPTTAPTNAPNIVQSPAAVPVGPVAGAASAADVTAQNSAAQGDSLQKAADNAPNNKATIANLEDDLGKISTGPNAAKINALKAGTNVLTQMVASRDLFDPKTIAAQEQFHKNATILAQQQFASLGGTGTDQQLASANGSNPSEALSTMGNKQILQLLKGNQDAIAVKNTAWQQWKAKNGAGTYGAFSEDWNKTYSPRAFQWVHMAPEDRKDMVKNMSPQERGALNGALQTAEDRGWIKPPDAR